jgi:hypothetical protein
MRARGLRDKQEIAENREKIRRFILEFLKAGSMYRKELHVACCRKLGKSDEPSSKPSRICKDMPDSWFDVPLKEMLESKTLRKERRGRYVYYHLV